MADKKERCRDCAYLVEGEHGEWVCDIDGTDIEQIEICEAVEGSYMTGREAIERMNEPKEFMKGDIFNLVINFWNHTNPPGFEWDEVDFTVDCSKPEWRNELLALWEDFRKENNLPERIVEEAWSTLPDDDDLEAWGYDPATYYDNF